MQCITRLVKLALVKKDRELCGQTQCKLRDVERKTENLTRVATHRRLQVRA